MAAAKKPRKRRRKTSTLSSAPKRRYKRRSKPRSLSSGGGGGGKMTIMKAGKNSFAGALGGGVYTAPFFVVKMPLLGKLAWGVAGSIAATMLTKNAAVGAGMAGAMAHDIAKSKIPTLNDDYDLQDTEYVDADTLSDTGYMDDEGNALVMDDDGVVYALNDDGDYEAMSDIYSLQEGTDMQSVSMIPMQDNAYALAMGY